MVANIKDERKNINILILNTMYPCVFFSCEQLVLCFQAYNTLDFISETSGGSTTEMQNIKGNSVHLFFALEF